MVGPLVVAANVLGAGDALEESLLRMTFGGAAAIGGIVLAIRVALPRAIRIVTVLGGGELFLGLVLLVVLGASWATHEAGLSAGLGAFLAGLLVADTEYRHQIAADIAPFRGLLLGLFFMAIGMGTDLAFAWTSWRRWRRWRRLFCSARRRCWWPSRAPWATASA